MENCHPRIEQAKVELLEQLYRGEGRDRKGHPSNGLYTGLYQNWTQLNKEPAV